MGAFAISNMLLLLLFLLPVVFMCLFEIVGLLVRQIALVVVILKYVYFCNKEFVGQSKCNQ